MKVLVTGGTGFVGRAFVKAARVTGWEVALAGRQLQSTGSYVVDLRAGIGLERVPWGDFQAVVHLAAAGVKFSQRKWPECVFTNVVGTQRLLDAVATSGARPIVWMAQTFYERETQRFPRLLENPYIATKCAATSLATAWAERTGNPLVFGRIFQAFGSGDDASTVLSYAAAQFRANQAAVFGSGRGRRDWISVEDVAAGIMASLVSTGSGVRTVELGTGHSTSLRDVVEMLAALAGIGRDQLIFDPSRDREDLEIDAVAKAFPPRWQPQVTLVEGLRRVLLDAEARGVHR